MRIPFDDKTFRYYDVKKQDWAEEGGAYEIYVGASVADIRLQGSLVRESGYFKKGYFEQESGAAGKWQDPYEGKALLSYRTGNVLKVTDQEFEELYGRKVPDGNWDKNGLLTENDAICQMYYAKSLLARGVWKILDSMKKSSEKQGKPNLNLLFIYNMPFRGISKMTGGALNEGMVDGLLAMVNGHFFRGLGRLVISVFRG